MVVEAVLRLFVCLSASIMTDLVIGSMLFSYIMPYIPNM